MLEYSSIEKVDMVASYLGNAVKQLLTVEML